jgi:hypothetical protein
VAKVEIALLSERATDVSAVGRGPRRAVTGGDFASKRGARGKQGCSWAVSLGSSANDGCDTML